MRAAVLFRKAGADGIRFMQMMDQKRLNSAIKSRKGTFCTLDERPIRRIMDAVHKYGIFMHDTCIKCKTGGSYGSKHLY